MSKFWTNSSSFILIVLCGVLFMGTAEAETATVLQVIDEDTCLLEDGRRVRYLGINSPEKEDPHAREATLVPYSHFQSSF